MKHWWMTLIVATAFAGGPPHWWEREPMRIVDVVTSYDQLGLHSPVDWARLKAAQGYDTEHLEVMNLRLGLDDLGWSFRSKVAGRQNEDFLGKYLPEAKKHGIRVMIYFNVHWYNPDFARKYSDWLQIREDGRPMDSVYVTGTDFCVNSPWRQWVFQVLRDLAAYPIDGIFYDGPIFFPDTCYCRYCKEKFQRATGRDLPSKKNRKGKGARELLDFQVASLADFLHDSNKVLKNINPEIALYMNGGERGGNWATARMNRVLIREQDLLGSEGGFIGGDLTRTPFWKAGVTARLLETQSGGKPRVIFSASGHKPWTFSILPEPELKLLYADTIANAASVWFGMWPYEFEQPEMRAVTAMNHFVEKNKRYLTATKSEAGVALVWSDTSANFYTGSDAQVIELDRVPQRSDVGNLSGEFSGFADALLRSHTPFDVIDDTAIDEGNVSRYAAVLLPNAACISERTASRLREYVRGGGNLFATFESSLYNELGERRNDFGLADVFGVSSGNHIVGPKKWDFMKPLGKSPFVAGLARQLTPAPTYHLKVKPASGSSVMEFYKPLKGVYDGIPTLSGDAALVVNQFGKGRSVYFAGDLGNGINTFHLPEFLTLLRNALHELAPSKISLLNAPASLEVVLRSQENGKRLLLHLVNFTGEMTRPIERITPLDGIRATLKTGRTYKTARALVNGRELTVERPAPDAITIALPRIMEYELIAIE